MPLNSMQLGLSSLLLLANLTLPSYAEPSHGFSTWGKLKYPANFTHFEYTNPKAPKGGHLRIAALGRFDSLNPFIVRGDPAPGITSNYYATLLEPSHDESGAMYGYVAETVDVATDKKSVTFRLNPKALFHDGTPITAEDVAFSFEIIRTKGWPMYRSYYADISHVTIQNPHELTFHFKTDKNEELPLIIGQLAILSKAYYTARKFDEVSLKPPPGSGPYEIESIDPGHSITYRRTQNWWGQNLPCQAGCNNFDRITYDMYRDTNSMFEAFKAGRIDIHHESMAARWKTAYNFPAVAKGWVTQLEIPSKLSSGTYGFFFNTRHKIFKDIRVRKALNLMFNFDWANKNIFHNAYKRNLSYFPGSDYAQSGIPQGPELKLLQSYGNKIPAEILTSPFTLSAISKDDNAQRESLAQAKKLLEDAGLQQKNGVFMLDKAPFEFEVMLRDKSQERFLQNFVTSLQHLGIKLKIRVLDAANYQKRLDNMDFDMVIEVVPQSNNLGNEQRNFFGSAQTSYKGSKNYAGIENPIVDDLIEKIINADSFEEQVVAAKAMDRVLLWNYYMIPAWHKSVYWLAMWNKIGRPDKSPIYHPMALSTWWYDNEKAQALETQKNTPEPKPSWLDGIKSWFS